MQKKFVIGKMKDETAGVAIKGFVRLKPKMCLYLVNDNSEQKMAIGVTFTIIWESYYF